MTLDFILMAGCIFISIFLANKKNSDDNLDPDFKNILIAIACIIGTLLVETISTRILAPIGVGGCVVAEIFAMLLRCAGIILILYVLNGYKPTKKFIINPVLCIPVLALVANSYYNTLFDSLTSLYSTSFAAMTNALAAKNSAGKIGLFMVLIKTLPAANYIISYAINTFFPHKEDEEENNQK